MSRFEQPDDNGLSFYAPLVNSLILARGTGNPTFTRATTAYQTDHTATLNQVLSGEARFQGARRVRNIAAPGGSTENLTAAPWGSAISGTGTTATCTAGFTAPDGSATAFRIVANRGASATSADFSFWSDAGFTPTTGNSYRQSWWIKSNTGSSQNVALQLTSVSNSMLVTATSQWQRVTVPSPFLATGGGVSMVCIGTRGNLTSDQAIDVLVWHPQLEDVTAQLNQNPGPYVSSGVLAAPYHGAGVDGVKYFDTTNGNIVTSTVVTECRGRDIGYTRNQAFYQPGVAGSYCSTPDSVANSITGDISIQAELTCPDWSPAADGAIVSKAIADPDRSWVVWLLTTGKLRFEWDPTGSVASVRILDSTVAVPFTDGTLGAIKVDVDVDNGAGGVSATFWTSSSVDGPWTQLGAVATSAGTTTLCDTIAPINIGSRANGALSPLTATFGRVCIFNGINGTQVTCFNPNDWASGTTWVSEATRETWTINGNVTITNVPLFGYLVEEARTNLILQSEDFTTTWTTSNGTVTANAATAPSGAITADKIVPDATNTLHSVQQTIAKAASALSYAVTVYAKAAGYNFLAFRIDAAGANGVWCVFNLSNGTVDTAATAAGVGWTGSGATITALGNGFFKCSLVVTTSTEVSIRPVFCPFNVGAQNPFTPATFVGDAVSGILLWGAQLEQNTFPSSYIPTTTVAVTRNADLLAYPCAGNINTALGSSVAEITLGSVSASGNPRVLANTTTDPSTSLSLISGTSPYNVSVFDGVNSVNTSGNPIVANVPTVVASQWGTGGISIKAGTSAIAKNATFDGGMMTDVNFQIGTGLSSTPLNGSVRSVKIFQRAWQDADLTIATR
jgi:hypothetical protein